jgi:hypothetical protein
MTFDEWLDDNDPNLNRWKENFIDLDEANWSVLESWLRAAYDVGYQQAQLEFPTQDLRE